MENMNEKSAEPVENIKLVDPSIIHLPKVEVKAGEHDEYGAPKLTMMCSCGQELGTAYGELSFQTIYLAMYKHRRAVMVAQFQFALAPTLKLLRDAFDQIPKV